MSGAGWNETMVEKRVTYTLEVAGRIVVVENVPARVCLETGERLYSPETAEHLQQLVWGEAEPSRVIKVPASEII